MLKNAMVLLITVMTAPACEGSSTVNRGDGGKCTPACTEARNCCGDHCVNLQNDPQNCGTCGKACAEGTYCTGGDCVPPPCTASCGESATCCGAECCGTGKLCCDPQGPLSTGPACLDPSEHGTCPMGCAPLCICASPETPIATPSGNQPIASLRAGDVVYSVDHGVLRAVPIVRTNRVPVSNHHVIQVTLASGATLEISPGHPTADGRRFDQLRVDDALDGVAITHIAVIPYSHDATYDILPASDTGAYFAGGVLVGSTLAPSAECVLAPTAPLTTR